jgi:ABC-type uncharacterized transport system substrate-binding protein
MRDVQDAARILGR